MLLYQQHQLAVQRRQRAASSLCSLPRSPLHALNSVCSASQPASRPVAVLVAQKQQRVDQSVVVRAAKDGGMLDAELEATQKTLDKVLAAVQAAQAAQQMQAASPTVQDATLVSREQQLWDRQQALMDRMQQQWDEERKAFFAREQQLLSELAQLRHEVNNLLLGRAAAAAVPVALPGSPPPAAAPAAAAAAAAAASPVSSVGSSPAAAAAASSAASRPGASAFPGQATISGPTSASAAVAAAIRAVRDEGVTRAPSAGSDGEESDGTWQDLFDSSGQRAVSSVAGALAAVNDTDVLEGLDLSFSSSSSSRGRRRIGDSNGNGSSSTSNGSSSTSSTSSMAEGAESALTPSSSGGAADAASVSSSSSSSGGSAGSSLPVEVQKGDPEGPPPVLAAGDDDIYWVSKLHDGLMGAGYYPSDDEVENWFFAESTQTALLTFQACNGLPETGTTCEATWRMLMGAEEYEAAYGHLSSTGSNGGSNGGSSSSLTSQTVDTTESPDGEVTYSFSSSNSSSGPSNGGASASSSSGGSSSSPYASSSGRVGGGGWPVVMDMDGGREVHALQVCLQKVGYFCGDDDMRWWQFGSSTLDALKTFQACNGLPESGVCDERTWLALLGPEAKPEDLDEVRGDESMYEDDMSAPHEGAVWLVGEQRWSKPAKQ